MQYSFSLYKTFIYIMNIEHCFKIIHTESKMLVSCQARTEFIWKEVTDFQNSFDKQETGFFIQFNSIMLALVGCTKRPLKQATELKGEFEITQVLINADVTVYSCHVLVLFLQTWHIHCLFHSFVFDLRLDIKQCKYNL